MNERLATVGGYVAFWTLFCALGILGYFLAGAESPTVEDALPPITFSASVDVDSEPPLLYIIATVQDGYTVGTLEDKTPMRTIIRLDTPPTGGISAWKSATYNSAILWWAEIPGYSLDSPTAIEGHIRVTLQSRDQCKLPAWYEFSTQ